LDLIKIKVKGGGGIRLGKVAGSIFKPFIVILIGACHKFNVKMSE
jgi:uncharacterized transporter YbjL